MGLLALLALPPDAYATAKAQQEWIDSAGLQRSCYAFVPDFIATSSPAPLLVLLHGSGQNGVALMRAWTELAAAEGIALVAPNAYDERYWKLRSDGPEFLRDVIAATASRHPLDPRRTYLFGLSGGAVYALTLSVLESEYFAATAVFAGAWRDEESLSIVPLARCKIPVAIFVGDRDEFFLMKSVKATEDALKQAGHPGIRDRPQAPGSFL